MDHRRHRRRDAPAHGHQRRRADGHAQQLRAANNFFTQIQFDFAKPAVANGVAYFAADDGVHGSELWKTDGTTTQLVTDINTTGANGSVPQWLVSFSNELYFVADDGTHHRQIWKTDGTNTIQVTNIPLGAGASDPNAGPFLLTVSGNKLYFIFYDGTADPQSGHQQEIYVTDGSVGGEHLLSPSHPAILDPRNLADINGTLYFTMNDGTHGYEVWKSDGTDAGTMMVKDIYDDGVTYGPAAPSSAPFGYTLLNGEVYFAVQDDGLHGAEIWKTDGTAAGTMMIKNINTNLTGGGPHDDGSIFVPFEHFTVFNNELYFTATDGPFNHGQELWKTNGTEAGTVMVADIIPGNGGSAPAALQVIDGALYFGAVSQGSVTTRLMKYDGVNPPVAVSDNYHYGAGFEYFSFIAAPPNSPPTVTALTASVGEDGPSFSQDLLSGASDPDADSLSIANLASAITTGGGRHLALGTDYTLVGSTLSLTGAGFAQFNGLAQGVDDSAVFGFDVQDVPGAHTPNTLTLTVHGLNDPPVANPDTGSAGENETKSFDVVANDTDVDVGDTLSLLSLGAVTVASSNPAINGLLLPSSVFTIVGGKIKFDPGSSFDPLSSADTATVVVGYTMQDNHSATASSALTLTVHGENDPPVIVSGGGGNSASYFVRVNEQAITTVISTDADVGDVDTFSIVGGADASRFSIDLNTGKLVFSGHPNQPNKSYTVQVQASDGHGGVDQQTITVNVSADKMNGDAAHAIDETFVFHPKFGANTVTNFDLNNDFLQFDKGMFAADTAAAVLAAAHDEKGGLGIDVHAGHLNIAGITKADLAAHVGDILFV